MQTVKNVGFSLIL